LSSITNGDDTDVYSFSGQIIANVVDEVKDSNLFLFLITLNIFISHVSEWSSLYHPLLIWGATITSESSECNM